MTKTSRARSYLRDLHRSARETRRLWPTIAVAWLLTGWAGVGMAQTEIAPPHQRLNEGPVEVTLELDAAKATIAEPITLSLHVEAPRGTTVVMPQLTERLGDFLVSESESTGPIPVDGMPERRRWTLRAVIESITSGTRQIPELQTTFRLPGSETDDRTIRSQPIPVEIISVVGADADPREFRELKGEVQVPPTQRPGARMLGWVLAAGVLLGAFAGWQWMRLRRRTPDPRRRALAQVDQLEARLTAGTIDTAERYQALSRVLREYLEASEGFPAIAADSEELVQGATRSQWNNEALERLRSFLARADAWRFAPPGTKVAESDETPLDQVRAIISLAPVRAAEGLPARQPGQEDQ